MSKIIFLIRKLLPELFLPIGFTIILLVYGIKTKSKKIFFSVLFILYFFSTNFVSDSLFGLLENKWKEKKYFYRNTDESVVIVLSGGIINSFSQSKGIYEWNDPDRFLSAIRLMKQDSSKKLIFTGGFNPMANSKFTEGEILKLEASNFIPIKNVFVTDNAFNTFQEAYQVKKLLNDLNFPKEITLITSAFHMRRAQMIFEKQGFSLTPYPVDFKSLKDNKKQIVFNIMNWIPNANNINNSTQALREIYALIYYKLNFYFNSNNFY